MQVVSHLSLLSLPSLLVPLPLLFKQSVELGLRVTAFGNETLSSLSRRSGSASASFLLFWIMNQIPPPIRAAAAAMRIPITIRRIFAGNPVFTSLLPGLIRCVVRVTCRRGHICLAHGLRLSLSALVIC